MLSQATHKLGRTSLMRRIRETKAVLTSLKMALRAREPSTTRLKLGTRLLNAPHVLSLTRAPKILISLFIPRGGYRKGSPDKTKTGLICLIFLILTRTQEK